MPEHSEEKSLSKAFAGMAADYDEDRFGDPPLRYFNEIENSLIDRLLGGSKGKRILDVGSGTGRIAIPLARAGAKVTAADLTPEMTLIAREKARRERGLAIAFCLASARELPFARARFEALTSVRMFHLIPKPLLADFIREMASTVRPGGTMVLEFNNAFYAGFMGLLRDFKNWRLARWRGMNRTHVLFPWEVGRICRGLGPVEAHGVYLPLQYRLHRLSPALARRVAPIASSFPFNFLSKNLLLRVRIGETTAR